MVFSTQRTKVRHRPTGRPAEKNITTRKAVAFLQERVEQTQYLVGMKTVTGPFDVSSDFDPPYDTRDGNTLGRARFEKRFHGPLDATSVVHMLSARTAVPTSGMYVAIERIEGTLEGRSGAFVVAHTGTMDRGTQSLDVVVVPDSATGALVGLGGRMKIRIEDGKHFYDFTYTIEDE